MDDAEFYFKQSGGRITHQTSGYGTEDARPLASIPYPGPAMGTKKGRNEKSEGEVVTTPVDTRRSTPVRGGAVPPVYRCINQSVELWPLKRDNQVRYTEEGGGGCHIVTFGDSIGQMEI